MSADDDDGHGGALHALRRAREAHDRATAHRPRAPHELVEPLTAEERDFLQAHPEQGPAMWRMKLERAKAQLAGDPSGGAS